MSTSTQGRLIKGWGRGEGLDVCSNALLLPYSVLRLPPIKTIERFLIKIVPDSPVFMTKSPLIFSVGNFICGFFKPFYFG